MALTLRHGAESTSPLAKATLGLACNTSVTRLYCRNMVDKAAVVLLLKHINLDFPSDSDNVIPQQNPLVVSANQFPSLQVSNVFLGHIRRIGILTCIRVSRLI